MRSRTFGKLAYITSLILAVGQLSHAQTFKTILSFDGTQGSTPLAGVIQGSNGSLYGETVANGAYGGGTVFRIRPTGSSTAVSNFCSQPSCSDGDSPYSGLLLSVDGNYYGATESGGAFDEGAIFKMTPSGSVTTLYSFTGGSDGRLPSTLVEAADGSFYGTTSLGANVCIGYGCGTVFRITRNGLLTTLWQFCGQTNCPDGGEPSGVVEGSDGNLYGTTSVGGAHSWGTVFKISPVGELTTLYDFCTQANCADGSGPEGLVLGSDGNFYGTTYFDGPNGVGTVYRISPQGTFTTLYSFCARRNCVDGAHPSVRLIQASDGNFYGTTFDGGSADRGVIFRMTPSGVYTVLHNFCIQTNCTDGSYPQAPVMQATDGVFYGTSLYGGIINNTTCVDSCGTVFRLSAGLSPFIRPVPSGGKIGRVVPILGNNLDGTTGVTFNGVPADFTVAASTLITATVPAGATTGTITVTTSSGTLSSNVPFRVLP